MKMITVVAIPEHDREPTIGPWFITCSLCGPLGMSVTPGAADLTVREHAGLHRVDIMTGKI